MDGFLRKMKLKLLFALLTAITLYTSNLAAATANYWLNARVNLKNANSIELTQVKFGEHNEVIKISETDYLLRGEFSSLATAENALASLSNYSEIEKVSSYFTKEHYAWSFRTKNNRLKPQERSFIKLQRLYITAGDMAKIAPIMLRYKQAFTANNIKRNVKIFTAVTGPDAPFIEITRYAVSKTDDVEYENSVNEAFGKALLTELSQSFGKYIRKGDAAVEGKVLF